MPLQEACRSTYLKRCERSGRLQRL